MILAAQMSDGFYIAQRIGPKEYLCMYFPEIVTHLVLKKSTKNASILNVTAVLRGCSHKRI